MCLHGMGERKEQEKEGGQAQTVSLGDTNAPHQGVLINIMCHALCAPWLMQAQQDGPHVYS